MRRFVAHVWLWVLVLRMRWLVGTPLHPVLVWRMTRNLDQILKQVLRETYSAD
jgi:hypothetical protein